MRAVELAKLALQQGTMVRHHTGTQSGLLWRFRNRFFSPVTINKLIEEGYAVRVGDEIVKTRS